MCCLHCGVKARPDATVWVDFDARRRPTVIEVGPVDLVDAGRTRIIHLYFDQCDCATSSWAASCMCVGCMWSSKAGLDNGHTQSSTDDVSIKLN